MEGQTVKFPVTWEQIHRDALRLAQKLQNQPQFDAIIAVCKGGLVPASLVARALGIEYIDTICFDSGKNHEEAIKLSPLKDKRLLIIDDIINTGKTAGYIRKIYPEAHYASLYVKEDVIGLADTYITAVNQNTWFIFPWECE